MLKHLSASAMKYVDNATANLRQNEVRSAKKHRRSSIGDASFDTYVFENNVGYRIAPNEKFASYERARVKEALTKVRRVEDCAHAPVKVDPNGTVYFEGRKYSRLSCCGTNTGSPALRCFSCCKCCKPRPKEPSDFQKLGVGVVLYFKFLKMMSCAFLLLSLLATCDATWNFNIFDIDKYN